MSLNKKAATGGRPACSSRTLNTKVKIRQQTPTEHKQCQSALTLLLTELVRQELGR